jgi:cellulose synthase (UDP-forming)
MKTSILSSAPHLSQKIGHATEQGLEVIAGATDIPKGNVPPVPVLIPSLTRVQKREYRIWVIVWLTTLISFWIWWLLPEHNIGTAGFIGTSIVLAWITLAPSYFVFMLSRSCVPLADTSVPINYRVAMVTTKTPSEPLRLVRQTLEAMLGQKYPHDTWLADEDPSQETIDWCHEHGVLISTRKNRPDYHRQSWPRRTKCKEGNLAFFYDHYGYENYDLVVQMDADHVPEPRYLEEMIRPFADPSVGYVSAPSICDRNAAESWSARGRLYAEGALHGALQSGYNGGFAPLCIGSHYAVRTAALRQIGGLGPELAEDHSTTLMMNAYGWRGVHAINALAHGDGPKTFPDFARQEFQWARSLTTLLFKYTPQLLPKLPIRLKFQFLFSQIWYSAFSVMMLVMTVIPASALWLDTRIVNVAYPYFFFFGGAVSLSLVAMFHRLRRFGLFRPVDAKILSWEGTLFLFARWPWSLAGVIAAVIDNAFGYTAQFRVTPKGENNINPLPFRVLVPYVLLVLFCGLPVVLLDVRTAFGYLMFSWINALVYGALLICIILKHAKENKLVWSVSQMALYRWAKTGLIMTVLAVPLIGIEKLPQGFNSLLWIDQSHNISFATRFVSSAYAKNYANPTMLSATSPVAYGVYDPEGRLKESAGITIQHIFIQWQIVDVRKLRETSWSAAASGETLLVTVEPFTRAQNWRDGAESLFAEILSGGYNPEILRTCGALRDTNGPVLVRWGHEMDDTSGRYPWAGREPLGYVKAYRHFVEICRTVAPNIRYVWSPTGLRDAAPFYPGDAYVDFVGISLYSLEAWDLDNLGRFSGAKEVLSNRYKNVQRYGKLIIVAELGVSGSQEYVNQWLLSLRSALNSFPLIRAIVFFNDREPHAWGDKYGSPDWRLTPEHLSAIVSTR